MLYVHNCISVKFCFIEQAFRTPKYIAMCVGYSNNNNNRGFDPCRK